MAIFRLRSCKHIVKAGFVPVVFIGHGLLVALFTVTAVVAATALSRTQTRVFQFSSGIIATYLSVILVLCKSLGSLVYAILVVPLVRLASPRTQIRVAMVLAVLTLLYPILRTADLVPVQFIENVAASISTERAASLKTRFDQERALLDRASERIFFGWGRWGRSRIYQEETGRDLTLSDGRWILTIGTFGLFGFFSEFGLLLLPVFRAGLALRTAQSVSDSLYLAALTLIVAIVGIDQLPNASLSPWTWLITGALMGRTEALATTATVQRDLRLSSFGRRSSVP